jgi:hypothetical protein
MMAGFIKEPARPVTLQCVLRNGPGRDLDLAQAGRFVIMRASIDMLDGSPYCAASFGESTRAGERME